MTQQPANKLVPSKGEGVAQESGKHANLKNPKMVTPPLDGLFEHVVDGGLISYGVDLRWCYQRAAALVVKILRGSAPGDLPVEFPTSVLLSINLRIAKLLGLTVPPALLVRADEVIE